MWLPSRFPCSRRPSRRRVQFPPPARAGAGAARLPEDAPRERTKNQKNYTPPPLQHDDALRVQGRGQLRARLLFAARARRPAQARRRRHAPRAAPRARPLGAAGGDARAGARAPGPGARTPGSRARELTRTRGPMVRAPRPERVRPSRSACARAEARKRERELGSPRCTPIKLPSPNPRLARMFLVNCVSPAISDASQSDPQY